MHTLAQLKNGELKGIRRLQLSAGLTQFPEEIYALADSLEILDLSNNNLSDLPDDLHRLKQLKILFCANNQFKHVPECLAQCDKLDTIGFKHNQIEVVSETCLPKHTRWLILTDNRLTSLPNSIGDLHRLEKLALAGNALTVLPDSLANCQQLALLRISANALAEFPQVLMALPKLAWLAFSGNPFCSETLSHPQFPQVTSKHINLQQLLGQGASGEIFEAHWHENPLNLPERVAVKIFKGEVTSDGYPQDELDACLSVDAHDNIVCPLARIEEPGLSALVMELIPSHYQNLGLPPSLQTCSRDTFHPEQTLTLEQALNIIDQMENLVAHLEAKQVCHGDLYAHNVLMDAEGHILFGDFGAASKYHHLPDRQQAAIRQIERRALTYFVEDMLSLCAVNEQTSEALRDIKLKYGIR